MTLDTQALVLGGGRVRADGRPVGQVRGCYVDRAVSKAMHDTNFGLEFKTDHVLAIKTAYTLGWTFEEVQPVNANMLVGQPGYGMVPYDRSLPGPRRSPDLIQYSTTRRQYVERPRLFQDNPSALLPVNTWAPLLYPIAAQNTEAHSTPTSISIVNKDFTGTLVGYLAFVIETNTAGADPSLPSDIAIVPYSATSDTLRLTFFAGGNPGTTYTIYSTDCVRNNNSEFEFATVDVNFLNIVAFTDQALPAPNADGSYTIEQGIASEDLDCRAVNVNGAAIPLNPTIVNSYEEVTGAFQVCSFPRDYLYDVNDGGGGKIKATPNTQLGEASPITNVHGRPIEVTYWYDIALIRELPLHTSGENPVIEITLEILFPDQESKMIWHFYKAQVNGNMRIAVNETDWMGVDFTAETLDASGIYPKFGFGYMQLIGPIVEEIHAFGNQPFDGIRNALGGNQTTYG